jgi:hypothetical protein
MLYDRIRSNESERMLKEAVVIVFEGIARFSETENKAGHKSP